MKISKPGKMGNEWQSSMNGRALFQVLREDSLLGKNVTILENTDT
jgi:hypothetical protein